MMPDIEIGSVAFAAILLAVVFIGMRLLYGYWPWQPPKVIRSALEVENWQLKGALGYPVPADIPEGKFKCGLCEARRLEDTPLQHWQPPPILAIVNDGTDTFERTADAEKSDADKT